ncbi:NAD(P)-binding domain-containing protein [Krasilnikovia sp. MM14-A1259]|uniref:NAD(P)-binding domain-containing protein n=1 Tax=Krasilnikovia sp. MM14-A1259 TaxID=3373539 RepID=UPI00382FE002
MENVCIIGAGASGLTACQALQERGIGFDCYESGSEVGGNWRYGNDNGMSSSYRSLHINTSKNLSEYRSFPMPADYPPFPNHVQMAHYFDDFVDHFGFRDSILFRTEVIHVRRSADGGWTVTARHRDTGVETVRRYRAVLVANGHHWDPRWPEPGFPGADTFTGTQTHSHHYKVPDAYAGKRVVVLGFGNSASDIAVETSKVSARTTMAIRSGGYVFPKFMFGKAADDMINPFITRFMPRETQRWVMAALLRTTIGKVTDYGLPAPQHKLFNSHPTVSETLLAAFGHGDLTAKPTISHFDGDTVHYVDGTSEVADAVIYCTGYKISFPFLDDGILAPTDNEVALYHRVIDPAHEGLYFIGLFQPLGATTVLAEAQAKWVADLLAGTAALPPVAEMRAEIAGYREALAKRYVASKRHTIQVDHYPYLAELAKERRAGARRARKAARRRPVPPLPADYQPREVSVHVDADPMTVWRLISDVKQMGRWSPECRRCIPLGRNRGVGGRFIGVNRRGKVVWVTMNRVEQAEPGRSFAFRTITNGVRWGYRLQPHDGGTLVTEWWDVSGQSPAQRARTASFAEMLLDGYGGHNDELLQGMHTTLARVKAEAERITGPRPAVPSSERDVAAVAG